MSGQPIDFYFEFASPYGYLASLEIGNVAEKYGRTVNWRPFMLGAAFKVTNSAPNMTIPMKGDYLARDIVRCAKMMNVPIVIPDVSPMNSLAAMRAFYWLNEADPEVAVKLAKGVFRAHWAEGRDLSPAEAVAAEAAALDIDANALIEAIQDPTIKELLKQETQTGIDRGAFGSPFFSVDGEAYWGHDRMGQIEYHLEHGGI